MGREIYSKVSLFVYFEFSPSTKVSIETLSSLLLPEDIPYMLLTSVLEEPGVNCCTEFG